jgi:hypothetical protein
MVNAAYSSWGSAMEHEYKRYEKLAFAELEAASRSLSVQERLDHEGRAYLFALKAHQLEAELQPVE